MNEHTPQPGGSAGAESVVFDRRQFLLGVAAAGVVRTVTYGTAKLPQFKLPEPAKA